MKKRLIFMHLPKCGGSTLHPILRRNYSDEELFSVEVTNDVHINTDELKSLDSEGKKKIRLIKGHVEFGIHELFEDHSEYITFLRDPVDRITSYYYYVKRRPNHRLRQSNDFTDDMTLIDFVKNIDERDLNNGQIKFISGIEDTEEIMLQNALKNIEKYFSFVGTVDKYDESLLLLSEMYAWNEPFYGLRNKTKNRLKSADIDAKTLDVIREFNAGDISLYEKYSSLLNEKIAENISKVEVEKFKRKNKWYNTKNKLKQKVARALGK